MKKMILLFWGILLSISSFCHTSDVNKKTTVLLLEPAKIDKRIELLSIIFRLAGNPEYNQNNFKIYTDAIHNHFDIYKNHPAVQFARRMADSNDVCFDAPMSLALHIEQPPVLNPLFPFSDTAPEKRWGKKNAEHFVTLLKQFYVDAKCGEFFDKQAELYKTVEERFKTVTNTLDINWYKQFYGTAPTGSLNIFIGISNGGCNYGPNVIYPSGREDAFAIMGTWSMDNEGMPIYKAGFYLSTLIHEFNHSFINHLNEKSKGDLENSGKILFEPLQSIMRSQAYSNWNYMMNEALVRAAVIRYILKHNPNKDKALGELGSQISNGFIWMNGLVDTLGDYENNRDKYPTLEHFMPVIVNFYNNTAKSINALLAKCAHVKAIEPFADKSNDVSPDLTEMKIVFDKPIFSEEIILSPGPLGEDHYPALKDTAQFAENNISVMLKLKLKPDTKYQIALSGLRFHTAEGYPLIDYVVEFKTKMGSSYSTPPASIQRGSAVRDRLGPAEK